MSIVHQSYNPDSFFKLTKKPYLGNNSQPATGQRIFVGNTTKEVNKTKKYSEDALYDNSVFDDEVLDLNNTTRQANSAKNINSTNNSSAAYNTNMAFYNEVNQALNSIGNATNQTAETAPQNSSQTPVADNFDNSNFYATVNQKLSDIEAIFNSDKTASENPVADTVVSQEQAGSANPFSTMSLEDITSACLPDIDNLVSNGVDMSVMSYYDNSGFYSSVNTSLNNISSASTSDSGNGSSLSSTMSAFKGYGDYDSFPSQPKASNLKKCKHKKGVYKDKTTGKYWKKDANGWYVDVTSEYTKKKGHK